MNTTKVTVASTETDVLKTEELIVLGEILQNPKYDNLLQQHYADLFGSRGEIIGKITDKKLTDIVNGIIETCNDNIEISGCRQEPEVYINLTDRQFNEEKQWIREKLEEIEIDDNESICSNCGKKTNDNTETKFDDAGDPYCPECYEEERDRCHDEVIEQEIERAKHGE